jgi:hypothetical protein
MLNFKKLELKWSARKSNKNVFLLSFPKFLDLILASTIHLGCIPCLCENLALYVNLIWILFGVASNLNLNSNLNPLNSLRDIGKRYCTFQADNLTTSPAPL